MRSVQSLVGRFVRDEQAASMVEYGLLVGLIAAVCVTAVALFGAHVNSNFQTVAGP